jgi:hypothetical protein
MGFGSPPNGCTDKRKIYIYIYTYMCTYVYTNIYIKRERERETETNRQTDKGGLVRDEKECIYTVYDEHIDCSGVSWLPYLS